MICKGVQLLNKLLSPELNTLVNKELTMTSKSPLDLKFYTESSEINVFEHFNKFNDSVRRIDSILTKAVKEAKIDLSVLDDESDPSVYSGELGESRENFKTYMNEVNKKCKGSKLKSVVKRREYSQIKNSNFIKKLRGYAILPSLSKDEPTPKPPDLDALTLLVKLYRPVKDNNTSIIFAISQEFEVHGDSNLSDLKDLIRCNSDYCGLYDESDTVDPSIVPPCVPTAKLEFPSSYFLIDHRFYIDSRPGCHDLTSEVRTWLQNNRRGESFEVHHMEKTLFKNLTLKIGRPYLYLHQGSCEHLFVISNIRYRSYDDTAIVLKPTVRAVGKHLPKHCMLCTSSQVHWFVKDFYKLTVSNAFLCHRCFNSFCYIDGRKVSDFKAYRYIDQPVAAFH